MFQFKKIGFRNKEINITTASNDSNKYVFVVDAESVEDQEPFDE